MQISSGGGDVEGVTHPRQCGTTQAKYIVATPFSETKILFKSDGSITDRGFNMSYELSPCGGIMEGPVANVLSPNFPGSHFVTTTNLVEAIVEYCVWKAVSISHIQKGFPILLLQLSFDLLIPL